MGSISISLPLAFLAGLVSFLSPCVLPIVPSYVAFVSGMTLDELADGSRRDARRAAALHAALFGLGFLLVFMTLGATATAMGRTLNRYLPLVSQLGGGLVIIFGLYLAGVLRLPALSREFRIHLARKPAGALGSLVVGIVFGLTLISISFRAMNPVVWSLMVTSLAAFPALLLILHAVDLRAGLCLLPTVYSIPFAFLSGALLWLFSGFALLWSASF